MQNNGLYIGQKLLIPELDNQNEYKVTGIFPGGMGLCIKIENTQNKEILAIKGLKADILNNQETYLRFIRELDIWFTASSCDGVVEAQGIIKLNELPYMVTEWAEKGDLFLSFKQMTPEQKIQIFLEITETLNLVYNKFKVIHRDLKPQNILITGNNRALVSDWGLAKIYDEEIIRQSKHVLKANNNSNNSILKTQEGVYLGTALYVSPEQILDASSVDCRSDIYSLGCILYELETDYPPFVGNTVESILLSHLYMAPPKLGGFFKRTNLGLEKVIAKCLKKNPDERYQTYDEMIQDIKKQLKSRGIPQYIQPQIRYNHKYPEQARLKLHNELIDKGKIINGQLTGVADAKSMHEEALMLLNTNRYNKCIELLDPIVNNIELIPPDADWFYVCDLLLTLALAYTKAGKLEKAELIYTFLLKIHDKPAEFYVNYSLLLLSQHKPYETINVCKKALLEFTDDPDLLGNCADAYIELRDSTNAIKYAKQRISVQGSNLHAYTEMDNALRLVSESLFNKDLDAWGRNMYERFMYISKGLALNNKDDYINFAKIQFLSEVDEIDCLNECNKIFNSDFAAKWLKEIALGLKVITLKEYARNKDNQVKQEVVHTLGDFVKLYGNDERISHDVRSDILEAYFFMIINFCTRQGDIERINQLKSFYLSSPFSHFENNDYRFPIEIAQIYKKSGETDKALEILTTYYPKHTSNWYFLRTYILFLLEDKQIDLAHKIALQGIEELPASVEAWDSLYFVINDKGQKAEAEKVKSKADELFKHKVEIKKTLRKLYCKE